MSGKIDGNLFVELKDQALEAVAGGALGSHDDLCRRVIESFVEALPQHKEEVVKEIIRSFGRDRDFLWELAGHAACPSELREAINRHLDKM